MGRHKDLGPVNFLVCGFVGFTTLISLTVIALHFTGLFLLGLFQWIRDDANSARNVVSDLVGMPFAGIILGEPSIIIMLLAFFLVNISISLVFVALKLKNETLAYVSKQWIKLPIAVGLIYLQIVAPFWLVTLGGL